MSEHLREDEFLTYLDGRLSAAERARRDEHLSACATCRTQLDELRALMGVLDEWKAIRPSPGFDASVQARLEGGEPPRPGWFILRPVYGVAAAVVLLVAIGAGLWQIAPPAPAPAVPQIAQTQPTVPSVPSQQAQPTAPGAGDDLAVLDNPLLLDNYELLEEFDVLFEPLNKEKRKL